MRHQKTPVPDKLENTRRNNAALSYNSLRDRKRPLPPEKHNQLALEFMRPDNDLLKNAKGLQSYPTSLEEALAIVPQRIRRRLLKIARADKYASEKIINRPALATALTLLGGLNDDELTQWLHRTDTEILSLIGFPVTARNIFKRLVRWRSLKRGFIN